MLQNQIPMKLPWIFSLFLLLTIPAIATKTPDKEADLTILGFVNLADGIGRQSWELLEALHHQYSVTFVSTRPNKLDGLDKNLVKIVEQGAEKYGKIIIYEDFLEFPEHTKNLLAKAPSNSIKIAYSMTEYSLLPQGWVEQLNELFDAIVVPDPFLVKVYERSGIKKPIFVIPLGLNLQPFFDQKIKSEANTPFTFLNLSSCIARKNLPLLVEAFAKAFGDAPEVALRINSRYADPISEFKLLKTLNDCRLSNIKYTRKSLSPREYLELFKHSDCYVSLSKGEGFSIQPREAMALGIPCIITDNSAQHTICLSNLVEALPANICEPAWLEQALQPVGSCYNCDLESAVQALRETHANYLEHLQKNEQRRAWASQYLFKNLQSLYKTLIDPQKIALSSHNIISDSELTTSSRQLYEKYVKLFPKRTHHILLIDEK